MGLLSDRWDALNYSEDTLYSDREEYRMFMHRVVGEKYPWLTAELYTIEGELGWGPGFRDYEEDFFLTPPETPSARSRMKNFVHTLDSVEPDLTISNAVSEVHRNEPTTHYAKMLRRYVRKAEAANGNREHLIRRTYYCIADRYFPETYVIGAARIYKLIWEKQNCFILAIAGLLKLYYAPLTKIGAGVETSKRRIKVPYMPMLLSRPPMLKELQLPVLASQFAL